MAQDITLMGASFSDVPAVTLPKTGGGTATFTDVTDTTATAADVLNTAYFYTAAGVRTQGTNSGGGGGGASNIVTGTFTTGSTAGASSTNVSLNYTGSGYPIACFVYVDGGPYNNGTGGNTTWYNSVVRYDCGFYAMVKSRTTTTPTYSTSGADNYGTVAIIYKNSTSQATTYTRTSSMTANTYTSSSSSAAASTACIKFKGNGKTLAYYIGNGGSGTIGLAKSTKYAYIVVYSS